MDNEKWKKMKRDNDARYREVAISMFDAEKIRQAEDGDVVGITEPNSDTERDRKVAEAIGTMCDSGATDAA